MDRILHYTSPDFRTFVAAVALFSGAAMAAHQLADGRTAHRELASFQAETAAAIAQQGNEALRRIRGEARLGVRLSQPVPLAEQLGTTATEIAAK